MAVPWSLRVALRQNLNYWEIAKQKVIAKIYGDWEEPYNRIPALLQALQECLPCMIHECIAVPCYNGDMVDKEWSQFDKVFWAFPPCIESFKQCKPFVSVDETHLYGKYRSVLLIVVTQDGNNNILPIAFSLVESEAMESWSFFLSNLRQHVTPQPGILIISDRSQAIRAPLNAPHSGWHRPLAYHVYYIRHMASNLNSWFKSAEGKRYLINAMYSPGNEGCY
ncbi:uncharacterized protein [Arachis hypogaea]|uniref:uncharacterized protein n=1 Tax=Arachis hypogaea TaxID=3818 RepID=UPI000DED8D45|nr:uncharacterized protein LOC112769893 [Arachis hypogaea]